MPMMEKLIDTLKESPPDTPEELEQLLSATGYNLVPTEPEGGMPEESGDEAMEDAPPAEEEGEEAPEDMGPDEEAPDEEADILRDMMPMAATGAPMNPRMKLRVTTIKAAKNAMPEKGKKRGK